MHCCPNCGSNLSALEPVEFGNVAIDEDGTIILDGRRVRLTRTLYRVAECIIRARGRGVTRDILAARLDSDVFDGSIKKYIERVRTSFRAIDPGFDQIRSLHGFGAYCWRFRAAQLDSIARSEAYFRIRDLEAQAPGGIGFVTGQ